MYQGTEIVQQRRSKVYRYSSNPTDGDSGTEVEIFKDERDATDQFGNPFRGIITNTTTRDLITGDIETERTHNYPDHASQPSYTELTFLQITGNAIIGTFGGIVSGSVGGMTIGAMTGTPQGMVIGGIAGAIAGGLIGFTAGINAGDPKDALAYGTLFGGAGGLAGGSTAWVPGVASASALAYRVPVTFGVRVQRIFRTATGYQQVVNKSYFKGIVSRMGFEWHHWAAPRTQMERAEYGQYFNAGWNLFPIPGQFNGYMSDRGVIYNLITTIGVASPFLAYGTGYGIGSLINSWFFSSEE